VDAELARPEFEGIAARNVMREPAEQEADGPGLAALAGEIDSIRRSTAEPPVRL
jgi:hypothetical protein